MCLLDARFYAKPLIICFLVDIPSRIMSYVTFFQTHFAHQRINDESKVIQLYIISLRAEFRLQTV